MERKISDLLDYIQDDTVRIRTKDVASSERVKELFMKKAENSNIANVPKLKRARKVFTILAAAVLMTALTVTVFAYSGILSVGTIFINRDRDVEQRSQVAQEALEDFIKTVQPQETLSADLPERNTQNPDVALHPAQAVLNWFAGLLDQDSLAQMEMSDRALELKDGTVMFFFSPGEDHPLYADMIDVHISSDGRLYGIDLRGTHPYPQPENCPEKYIFRGLHRGSGIEYDFFIADLYLSEVAYPDRAVYSALAESAAIDAMALLVSNGFADADPDAIEVVYYEHFDGGAAWVDVLMENGDNYCLYLHPDDFRLLGFALYTPERLSAGDGNAALFDALRRGVLEEYQKQQQELIATGVG